MMDANAILSAISSVGFPIVCCIAMWYLNMKGDERHQSEIQQLQEAINNNTLALTKLVEKLERGDTIRG